MRTLPLILTAALLAASVIPVASLVGAAPSPAPATAPAQAPLVITPRPGDGSGAYATGKYRNLFLEDGHTQAEIDAKIEKAYQQLFHGDKETQLLFFPVEPNENGPMAYIPDIQHTDVRSEGMSYGMMITVQLDKKAEFDALWNWSMTHMYHDDPKHPTYGFFSWQMRYDGSAISELPAPDGEEYYAMALLFASNRWGDGKGIYDYKTQAMKLLHNIVHRESITGTTGRVPPAPPAATAPVAAPATGPAARGFGGFGRGPRQTTIGKEVYDDPPQILFSPDERSTYTDMSYHLPGYYELWARWGPPEDHDFWVRAADTSRALFYRTAYPTTGLVPNQSNFDGSYMQGRGGNRGGAAAGPPRFPIFAEDAWRCESNWSVDWSWFAKDPHEQELSDRIQGFFEKEGMDNYNDNFTVDGAHTQRVRHSPGLTATNGAASLAASNKERAKKFTEALWDSEIPSSFVFRYYDGLLYMMNLMHCSGKFQIIKPKG